MTCCQVVYCECNGRANAAVRVVLAAAIRTLLLADVRLCRTRLPERPERRARRVEDRDAEGEGRGRRPPAGAAARVPAARGDSVPRGGPVALRLGPPPLHSTPVSLFRLDYTFKRDRVDTSRVHTAFTCFSHLCVCRIYSRNVEYCTSDFTSRNNWVGSCAAYVRPERADRLADAGEPTVRRLTPAPQTSAAADGQIRVIAAGENAPT